MEGRGGGAFVTVPFDVVEVFGTKGQLRVKGTIDGHPLQSSVAPMGGGRHVLGVHKATRAAIGKSIGDRVAIVIEPDLAERTVSVPDDLARAFAENRAARTAFEKLAYTQRKEYVEWIEQAKRAETRQRRIAQAIERLTAANVSTG
ncbi:MAG: YdeI/OmpD-associated family protein [Candidatus Dormibacteraeota bacterium]|nr:YdeI/OmpD-associated family protein [Candidatus Dormibacteraeota bacterium]